MVRRAFSYFSYHMKLGLDFSTKQFLFGHKEMRFGSFSCTLIKWKRTYKGDTRQIEAPPIASAYVGYSLALAGGNKLLSGVTLVLLTLK